MLRICDAQCGKVSLRRGEGTPPYRLFFMSVTHHKYSVGNGLDRSGASCLYPIIEFTTGPVRGVGGRCPLQIKYYAITFLGTLVLWQHRTRYAFTLLSDKSTQNRPAGCSAVPRQGGSLSLWQYRIILSADTASEVRQMLSQKRR